MGFSVLLEQKGFPPRKITLPQLCRKNGIFLPTLDPQEQVTAFYYAQLSGSYLINLPEPYLNLTYQLNKTSNVWWIQDLNNVNLKMRYWQSHSCSYFMFRKYNLMFQKKASDDVNYWAMRPMPKPMLTMCAISVMALQNLYTCLVR